MTAGPAICPGGTCPSFIGRQRELTLLWDQLQAARGGQARVVLISGEPGIGKSRLLAEIGARAAVAGAAVLLGGASQAAGMPPYLPFVEALGRYVRQAPADRLRRHAGPAAGILAGILPELAARLTPHDLGPDLALPEGQARLRLYQAAGQFLAAVAAEDGEGENEARGLVLLLDDLQWADAASLDLLCHVVRHEPAARLLVVGAYRAAEVESNPVLERALDELTRLRVLTALALAPLSEQDTAALAASYLGAALDAAAGRLLYGHSEGTPFFVEELLRDWIESGVLVQRSDGPEGRRAGTPAWTVGAGRSSLPPSIVGAIRQRLARLAPAAVDHLRVAAIIGRTFSASLLAEVQGQALAAVEDCLDAAERAHLVRGEPSGSYTFSHDTTRECLYAEVSASRRRRLHERIGLALEAWPPPVGAQHLADLAFHFARNNDRERAVGYARRAAEQALRAYAPVEAAGHYRTALDRLEAHDERRGELLLGLGDAALLAAADGEAAAAYDAAESWLGRQASLAADPAALARAAHGRGLALWRLDRPEAAREALERSLALLDEAGSPSAPGARVRVDLAHLLGIVLGRQDQALEHSRRALDAARRLGDGRLEAAAGRMAGFFLVRENDLAPGLALLEQALVLARANADPGEAAECCACLAQACCWSAQFERSRLASWWREEFARHAQQPYHLCYVYTWLAFLAAAQGDWHAAGAGIDRARADVERVSSAEPRAFWHQVRGYVAYQQGRYGDAEYEIRAAIATFREKHPGELLLCLGLLGLALLAAGKGREARDCRAELEGLLRDLSAGRLAALSARGCLTLMAVATGDAEQAAAGYQDLLACQGQHHWFLVDRILGEAAALRGDLAAAETHLLAARAIAGREGLRPELARVLEALARLSLAQAKVAGAPRARALLGQALAVARELDVPGEVKRLRRQLAELPHPPGTPPGSRLPGGLSRREAEVLRLVAAGMSNHDIAAALALSESTVAKHLTSIFNKTGVANRAAAAAFALRHGLAQ